MSGRGKNSFMMFFKKTKESKIKPKPHVNINGLH